MLTTVKINIATIFIGAVWPRFYSMHNTLQYYADASVVQYVLHILVVVQCALHF